MMSTEFINQKITGFSDIPLERQYETQISY